MYSSIINEKTQIHWQALLTQCMIEGGGGGGGVRVESEA